MEKPITVTINETKQKLVNVLNESKLPAWILRDILRDFSTQITELAAQQEQKEAQEWNAYQEQEQKKAETETTAEEET